MPPFSGDASSAGEHDTAIDQATTNTCSQDDTEHAMVATGDPEPGFRENERVGIVY
jgi:hypothetical protein